MQVRNIKLPECSNCGANDRNLEIRIKHSEYFFGDIALEAKEKIPNCCDELVNYFRQRQEEVKAFADYSDRLVFDKRQYMNMIDVYEFAPFSPKFEEAVKKNVYHSYCRGKSKFQVETLGKNCKVSFYEILIDGLPLFVSFV